MVKSRLLLPFVIIGVLLVIWGLALNAPVSAAPPAQQTEQYCLSCHGKPDLKMTLPNGEELSLYISTDQLSSSVHSPAGIECEACHTNIKTYPHPAINFQTRRDLSRSYYEACQKCHPANYSKTQDGIHATAAVAGDPHAPICTDCHGAHNVQQPDQPRSKISHTCSTCHQDVFDSHKNSIHGNALINDNNPDVPVCTDCHGVHNIQDPRTAQFRVRTPEMCAGCHADPQRMSKYNLPTDVYSLYQTSWHGVDISVYKANWPTIWHESAVCIDCHGVHDILPADDPKSSVNPNNLLATCQKCHKDAGPNWTSAWTGHNQIDLQRTPLLYAVDRFYTRFAQGVLWLCLIYVVLQIIHAIVDRGEEEFEMSAVNSAAPAARGVQVVRFFARFTRAQRWEHWLLFFSFTVLFLTGIVQKYRTEPWSQTILSTPQRLSWVQSIHHVAAIVLIVEVIIHLAHGFYLLARRKMPHAMFPEWQDVKDAGSMTKYLLFLAKRRPKYGKYSFEEKLTYWFLFFSIGLMVITGFVIWFPIQITTVLPGSIVPAAKLTHSTEAIVAGVFVLIWHLYHVLIERLNLSMFTGRQNEDDMRKYHAAEFERLTGEPADTPDRGGQA